MSQSGASKHSVPPEIIAIGGPPTRVKDRRFRLFGLVETSSNHIRDWRRMQFLLAAEETLAATRDERPGIDEFVDLRLGSGRAAGRASIFIPHEGVHKFSEPVQILSRLIGPATFQVIYNAPPPVELVNYTISPANQRRFVNSDPELGQVTVEALHGRIEWEDRFADAGVPTPEEYIQSHEPFTYEHSEAWA